MDTTTLLEHIEVGVVQIRMQATRHAPKRQAGVIKAGENNQL